MAQPLATPYSYFTDANGVPLSGGKVYTYAAGTTTPQASYTDSTGTVSASNPVILDSAGRATIWLSGYYKIVVKDSNDSTIYTTDNITALGSTGDMNKSVYDANNIQEQLVGLTAVQTITNKTLTSPTINTASFPTISNFVVGATSGLEVVATGSNTRTSNTTLSDITGLSITLANSKTYVFEAILYTTSNSSGGVKFGSGGTATFSAFRAFPVLYDSSVPSTNVIGNTGTAGAIGGLTATTSAMTIIKGQMTTSAAGTFTIQFAQNASNVNASTILSASLTARPIA